MGAVILRSKNEEIAERLLQVHINIEKQVKTPAWGALMEIDGSTLGVLPRFNQSYTISSIIES